MCAAGIHGVSFVMKEHRHKNLFGVMSHENGYRALLNNDVIMVESIQEQSLEELGESHVINIIT